jgi:hypothetical protein
MEIAELKRPADLFGLDKVKQESRQELVIGVQGSGHRCVQEREEA